MRHKIKMVSNLSLSYGKDVKKKFSSNPFLDSFHKVHPKIQSKYDEELSRYSDSLESSRILQLKLLIELENLLRYFDYAYETTKRASPLDLKWSNLHNEKTQNRLWLQTDYLLDASRKKSSKEERIKHYLFSEIGKGKDLNTISKLYKENKDKKFDCITLEFHQNMFIKKVLDVFSLLTNFGVSLISIPAQNYIDVVEILNGSEFYINALCSQRDHNHDKDGYPELINQNFNRPIYARYIVLVISRYDYGDIYIGSEFDESDFEEYWDSWLIEHFQQDPIFEQIKEPTTNAISKISERFSWETLPGFGANASKDSFFDLEHLYNQIKFNELSGDYLSFDKYELTNSAKIKTNDIYRTFHYLNNIKNTGKISIKNKSNDSKSHHLVFHEFTELQLDNFESMFNKHHGKKYKSKFNKNALNEFVNQYSEEIKALLNFKAPRFFNKIDKLLIIEWRVDGANNCQFCGIFHPKDWTTTEDKYWDPNYYVECIEVNTKIVSVEYLLMFYKTHMGQVLVDLAIDNLNQNSGNLGEEPNLWNYLTFLAPNIKSQSKAVDAINSIDNLTNTIEKSEQSIITNIDNIDDIVKDLQNWQASLGLLNNSDRIEHLISQGESDVVEFKETFSLDLKSKTKEIYMETSCLKTICGFLNSNGGSLLIGVSDQGEISGLANEIELFHKKSLDNLLKHFKNKLTHRIQGFDDFISYKAITIKKKVIIEVSTKAIEYGLGCYLDGKDFYIRRNPGTDKLEAKELVKYTAEHFKQGNSS